MVYSNEANNNKIDEILRKSIESNDKKIKNNSYENIKI